MTKQAILHDIKLEGRYCVTFLKKEGETEGLSFKWYPTQHEALLAISLFEYESI